MTQLEEFLREGSPDKLLKSSRFQVAFHLTTYDLSVYYDTQLEFLRDFYGPKLRTLLRENHCLLPRIVDAKYWTSEARMYHLAHLGFFEAETKTNLEKVDTVIEFGAGYGGSTELLTRRLKSTATICVIDFPAMLRLQYHYLSETSTRSLKLTESDGALPEPGKINLIPVSYSRTLESLATMSPDLLIATWSLSEGSRESQLAVIEHKFFRSKQILFGHYARAHALLPETDKMTFPGYETEYNGPCFFSRDEVERYHFLRQATVR